MWNMKKIKKMILAGIALSTLFAISGCGTSKDEVNSIKVGYFNNVTHAQALLISSYLSFFFDSFIAVLLSL